MDEQNPPFASENPPENPNPEPIPHKFSNDKNFPSVNKPNDDEYAAKMENFKALIFKSAILSSPTKSLCPILRSIIEKRFHELFPEFRTPDHPPYAAMIETAITKLNEDEGSTEEAISQFIRNEYPDLPQVHHIFLKYHLENLCADQVVAKVGNRFYMLHGDVVTEQSSERSSMLNEVVTRSPTLSPFSYIDDESNPSPSTSPSWSSSVSWSSSTSFNSFPCRKRKCQVSQRQKSVRRRGRKRKRVDKKAMAEKEIQPSADILMLEHEAKTSEEQTDGKEDCQYSQGLRSARKKGRKCQITTQRTRIYLHRAVKRQSRECKKAMEKELEVNSNIPMSGEVKELEEQTEKNIPMLAAEFKELEDQTEEKGGHRVVVECRDPVTGKRRRVIDIDLDELQDMVNEDYNELDSEERSIHRDNNLADMLAKETKAQSHHIEEKEKQVWSALNQTEGSSKFERHHHEAAAKVARQEDQLADGVREAIAKVEHQLIVKKSFLKETNFNVIEERSLPEKHDTEIVEEEDKEEQKRFQPCKQKFRGRQVHQKHVTVTGWGRYSARQVIKDLSAEQSQPNALEMEASLTQNLMLEKLPEVTEEQIIVNKEGTSVVEENIQGNGCETLGCSQIEDINMDIEMGKLAVTVEKSAAEEQHNLVTEGWPQIIGGMGRCDEQEERETLMSKKLGPSRKPTNELAEKQNKPERQRNKDQKHQAEKYIGPSTEHEVEEVLNQKQQIHQKTHPEEDDGVIGRRSPVGHVTEKNSHAEATILPSKSFSSAVEAEKENISKQKMEWQSDCLGEEPPIKMCTVHTQQKAESPSPQLSSEFPSLPYFLHQPQMLEDKDEDISETIEQKRDSPVEEGSEDIRSKHTQDKPGFSSPPGSSKMTLEEMSPQPKFMQQPNQAEEQPQGHNLWY